MSKNTDMPVYKVIACIIWLLACISLSIAAWIGWGINARDLVDTAASISSWGWDEVWRILGILFMPIGAILGWFS